MGEQGYFCLEEDVQRARACVCMCKRAHTCAC